MWVQVTGLMSEVDAERALAVLPDRFLRNASADVEVIAEHNAEPPSITGVTHSWAHESHTESWRGRGMVLMVAYVVGSKLVTLAASGLTGSWSWPALAEVAEKQARRLRGAVE
jgi:hypothetical protein